MRCQCKIRALFGAALNGVNRAKALLNYRDSSQMAGRLSRLDPYPANKAATLIPPFVVRNNS